MKQQKLLQRLLGEANDGLKRMLAKAEEGDASAAVRDGDRRFDTSLRFARQVELVLAPIWSGQITLDLGQQTISAIATLSSVRAAGRSRVVALLAKSGSRQACHPLLEHPDNLRLSETASPHAVCSFRLGRLIITARTLPWRRLRDGRIIDIRPLPRSIVKIHINAY